jgi:outer membrane protein assembly factor BamB
VAYVNAPYLSAVDVATGAVRWQSTVSGHGTPAVSGDLVVTATTGTIPFVSAVDASTGALVWQRRLPRYATTSTSITVEGARAFVAVNDEVWALWLQTGRVAWKSLYVNGFPTAPGSTPTVAHGALLVGASGSDVTALDERTGTRLWTTHTSGGNLLGDDLWVPVVRGETVYTGTADGVAALDLTTGHIMWANSSLGTMAWPLVVTSSAVIGSNENQIIAVSAVDGTVRWTKALGGVWELSGFGDVIWGQQLVDGPSPVVRVVGLVRQTGAVVASLGLPSSSVGPRPAPTAWGDELIVPYAFGVRAYAVPVP